jgi:tRNA threonylcarbamoyladenosine biosynthesis protein TsaB
MTILAIETTSSAGSVAIFRDGNILYQVYVDMRVTHSETLMVRIDNALSDLKIQKTELSAVCISNGPGSFTGVRIGLATARGICTGLNIPLIPFHTMQLLASNVYGTDRNILSITDARMGQAYVTIFDKSLDMIVETDVQKYEDIWDFCESYPSLICVGDASLLLQTKADVVYALPHQNTITASSILSVIQLKNVKIELDKAAVADLEPYYVRDVKN